MSIPIRARLYPKQGSGGLINTVKDKFSTALGSNSTVAKATSFLKDTPFGAFTNSVTSSNLLTNMANQGVQQVSNLAANGIGDTLGNLGGSLGGIVGGELGALTSDKLSSMLQGALGNNNKEWYVGPAYILSGTNGLTFPTTPTIATGNTANYDEYDMVHSNYTAYAYKNSRIEPITVTAKFPINSRFEADYFLGCLHFLRSVTKSHFGENDDNKGVPPPVLLFDAMGPYAFNAVPVVVASFQDTFEDAYDYVVSSSGTYVPTMTTLTVSLLPYFAPSKTSQEFTLGDFREGKLLGKGYI